MRACVVSSAPPTYSLAKKSATKMMSGDFDVEKIGSLNMLYVTLDKGNIFREQLHSFAELFTDRSILIF